jgi:hypothetical protein
VGIQTNALPPSLVADLNDMQRRITSLERKPEPLNRFDRYPCVEWTAQDRPQVGGNVWSSASIADVTGLTFDRIECKFITDFLYTGKREAEIRLATFRHFGNGSKACVSASSVLNLTGQATRAVAQVLFRWIHGIPFGWDYAGDTSVYTLELQHRYKTGPEPYNPSHLQVGAYFRNTGDSKGPASFLYSDVDGAGNFALTVKDTSTTAGWVTIPDGQVAPNVVNGSYAISAMQYCVGLPADRIPDATTAGVAYITGSGSSWARAGDITEAYF